MILISLQPYPFRKLFLIIAGLIILSSISCFADSLFLSVSSTGYNRQVTRVQPILRTKDPVQQSNLYRVGENHLSDHVRLDSYELSLAESTAGPGPFVLEATSDWAACRANQWVDRIYVPLYSCPPKYRPTTVAFLP